MNNTWALKLHLTIGTGAVVNYGRFPPSSVYTDNSLTSMHVSHNGVSCKFTARHYPQPNRDECVEWPSDPNVEQQCSDVVPC